MKIIKQIVQARPTTDGDGVNIKRMTGLPGRFNMDPFLMLDEIHSDNSNDFIGGFPPHPHRGFETITYMRSGGFSHTDSMGHTGTITAGGAQWMTAASGVIHSEMPIAEVERIHGFQFWLNMPASEKMNAPEYRDLGVNDIVELISDNGSIRLIAGRLDFDASTLVGPVADKATQPIIADITINDNHSPQIETPSSLHRYFYLYSGSAVIEEERINQGDLIYLNKGDAPVFNNASDLGILFFAGLPLNEPVVQHGPFVMNTQEEVAQAIRDYQQGTLVQAQ